MFASAFGLSKSNDVIAIIAGNNTTIAILLMAVMVIPP
jgi:hypothetical protein